MKYSSLVFSEDNAVLEVLDLSWNHLRQDGAIALANGLCVRTEFKYLAYNHP